MSIGFPFGSVDEDCWTILTVDFHHDGESGHAEQVTAVADVLLAGFTVSDMLDVGAVVDVEQLVVHLVSFRVGRLVHSNIIDTAGRRKQLLFHIKYRTRL